MGPQTFDTTPFPTPKSKTTATRSSKTAGCAICGADLHLFDNFIPGVKNGDIMGHETMGEAPTLWLGIGGGRTIFAPSSRMQPRRAVLFTISFSLETVFRV